MYSKEVVNFSDLVVFFMTTSTWDKASELFLHADYILFVFLSRLSQLQHSFLFFLLSLQLPSRTSNVAGHIHLFVQCGKFKEVQGVFKDYFVEVMTRPVIKYLLWRWYFPRRILHESSSLSTWEVQGLSKDYFVEVMTSPVIKSLVWRGYFPRRIFHESYSLSSC